MPFAVASCPCGWSSGFGLGGRPPLPLLATGHPAARIRLPNTLAAPAVSPSDSPASLQLVAAFMISIFSHSLGDGARTRGTDRGGGGGDTGLLARHRPFAMLSRTFSARVPRNKWSGRTQGGLSHVWQTCISSGIAPNIASHAKRWAPVVRMRPRTASKNEKPAYPGDCVTRSNTQQPTAGCSTTRAQNRFTSVSSMATS